MRPTLQHLPHELWGVPVFGIGWVVLLLGGTWLVALLLGGRARKMALESIPFAVVLGLVVAFLLPNFEEAYDLPDGTRGQGHSHSWLRGDVVSSVPCRPSGGPRFERNAEDWTRKSSTVWRLG